MLTLFLDYGSYWNLWSFLLLSDRSYDQLSVDILITVFLMYLNHIYTVEDQTENLCLLIPMCTLASSLLVLVTREVNEYSMPGRIRVPQARNHWFLNKETLPHSFPEYAFCLNKETSPHSFPEYAFYLNKEALQGWLVMYLRFWFLITLYHAIQWWHGGATFGVSFKLGWLSYNPGKENVNKMNI